MSLNLGNTQIKAIYLGSTKIKEAYLGSSKVYSSVPVSTDEVQIGNKIWKTKNLAIDDGQGGIYTQTVNYGQGNVVEYYYTWDAANRIANSISGWHLPTMQEWNDLSTAVGGNSVAGTKLKSTTGWYGSGNGTDDYGFTAYPAGGRDTGGSFASFSTYALFWTATARSSSVAYYIYLSYNYPSRDSYYYNKLEAYSVRLVKDA